MPLWFFVSFWSLIYQMWAILNVLNWSRSNCQLRAFETLLHFSLVLFGRANISFSEESHSFQLLSLSSSICDILSRACYHCVLAASLGTECSNHLGCCFLLLLYLHKLLQKFFSLISDICDYDNFEITFIFEWWIIANWL